MMQSKLEQMALPYNFQEVLIWNEMELQNKISVQTIRKLVYLYTLAMEYYNILSQDQFEEYYRDKVNQLLLRPDIMSYLDNKKVALSKQNEVNLFPDYDRKTFTNLSTFNNRRSVVDINNSNYYTHHIETKKTLNALSIKMRIVEDLSALENRMKKINKEIEDVIVFQLLEYDKKKRDKINKKDIELSLKHNLVKNNITDKETRRKSVISYNLMLKEIEQYIENNINEMNKALEELKKSYEREMKEAEESGYPGVSNGLKEDLELELENLKLLYEEQRINQTEIIKAKYKK